MRQFFIISILLAGCVLLSANSATDPVQAYLDAPDSASFQKAVSHLTTQLGAEGSNFRTRLYLHYLCDLEAERTMKALLADAADLAPGERFSLANYLLGKEEYQKAVSLYEGINKDYPTWSCPWRHKGEALYKMKDFAAAQTALTQAIATNENHYDAYIWMAKVQKELGLYREALTNLEKAMKLDPNAEESDDEAISEDDIHKLHQELKARLQ